MDVYEWDDWFPTDEEIDADIDARAEAEEAAFSAHVWCAKFHFLKTQAIYPEIDLPF